MRYDPREIDARIMRAIREFEGVPTANTLRTAVGASQMTIQKRIGANPELAAEMEKRGRAWLKGASEEVFLGECCKRGWNAPAYARELADERVADIIIREARLIDEIPSSVILSEKTGIEAGTITHHIKSNPRVSKAIEEAGGNWIRGLSKKEFLEGYASGFGKRSKLHEYLGKIAGERIDAMILREIERHEGLPSNQSLWRKVGVSYTAIRNRAMKNPAIPRKMEERGKAWIESLGREEFIELWGRKRGLPEYAREAIAGRAVGILLKAVNEFDGVPTANTLGKNIGITNTTIQNLIKANPGIEAEMERRGRAWLREVSDAEFLKAYSRHGWNLPAYARKIVEDRVADIIIREARLINGIPDSVILSTKTGIEAGTITHHINSNPRISRAIDEVGGNWIRGLSKKEFLEGYASGFGKSGGNLRGYAREIADERIDAIILKEIERCKGLPSNQSLAEKVGVSEGVVGRRVKGNPAIPKKMKEKAGAWIESMGREEFIELWGSTGGVPECAKEAMEERAVGILLKTINELEGAPTLREIVRRVGISNTTVSRYLQENETLWFAYQNLLGLSKDQAVELAIQRGEETRAISKAISARLRHLSASREVIGIMRCFGELFEKTVSCVSMYPDIVSVAAKEGGIRMGATHIPMKPFRRGEGQEIPGCGTVLVHGLHRLGNVGTDVLFRKIRELYAEHPELSIITTHSKRYSITEPFLEAMEKNGFVFKESGSLKVESPDMETLESYGVPADDLGRMSSKLTREINVGLFTLGKMREGVRIPELEKALFEDEAGGAVRQYVGMDVPEGIGCELRARFFPNLEAVAGDPFVFEVLHSGGSCALIGFDMHPKRARAIEVEVFPGAPAAEYRKIARMLATNLGFRRELGVKPNRLTSAGLKACTRAMKKQ